jgi:hypothetical protein
MSFLGRFSPIRAYKDLRLFLSQRRPHELGFLAAAIVITGFFVYAFMRNDYVPPAYTPNIIYVEQWPADRTDAQIRAQQVIDEAAKQKRLAEVKAEQERRRADFKRVDDTLTKYGL